MSSIISHWVSLTPSDAIVDGTALHHTEQGAALITELYKSHIGDYPKYYKMDPLSRVGFVASELLLKAENDTRESWGESRGVVLFNASASLADDTKFQATIDNMEAFFPSPAVFVYTLPNVLTGEIAIRNHYYGETNFIVLPTPDARAMSQAITFAFNDEKTTSLLTGWAECSSEEQFSLLLFIAHKGTDCQSLALEIEKLLNIK